MPIAAHEAAKATFAQAMLSIAHCGSSRELSLAKSTLQAAGFWIDEHFRLLAQRAATPAVLAVGPAGKEADDQHFPVPADADEGTASCFAGRETSGAVAVAQHRMNTAIHTAPRAGIISGERYQARLDEDDGA